MLAPYALGGLARLVWPPCPMHSCAALRPLDRNGRRK